MGLPHFKSCDHFDSNDISKGMSGLGEHLTCYCFFFAHACCDISLEMLSNRL